MKFYKYDYCDHEKYTLYFKSTFTRDVEGKNEGLLSLKCVRGKRKLENFLLWCYIREEKARKFHKSTLFPGQMYLESLNFLCVICMRLKYDSLNLDHFCERLKERHIPK